MRNSLKYDLNRATFESDVGHKEQLSDTTIKNYKAYNAHFRDFCMSIGKNTFEKVKADPVAILNTYVDKLKKDGKSAATIHTYLSAPCKALGVHMQDIQKPERVVSEGVRAGGTESDRSAKEKVSPEYRDAYLFVRAVGIRETEARRIVGSDLRTDAEGRLCVHVAKGKGGKEQMQRILPQYEDVVRAAFADKAADERLFEGKQFSKNVNYHRARAAVAQDAYAYYADTYRDPASREALAQSLLREYRSALDKGIADGKITPGKADAQLRHYIRDVYERRDDPYILRGANRVLAESKGLPVTYDRLAVMAVSVYHLSHWRADVTVSNYLLK